MIKIDKPSIIPPKLTQNKNKLEKCIQKFGSINSIPFDKFKKLINGYKHKEIQDVLFNSSFNKCSYCETRPSGGFLEIEHYEPKDIYPERSLEWDNLLPSCSKCNRWKSTHDTRNEPIINPCIIDPEPYFKYEWHSIKVSNNAPDKTLAERTIKICNLNRLELIKARMDIIFVLEDYEKKLKDAIDKFEKSESIRKEQLRMLNLIESLQIIKDRAESKEKYAGLCRYFLNTSEVYQNARNLTDEYNKNHPEI
ncbi:MAG: HNH endonuclease [Promethearchaeota archaeon]